MPSHSHREKRLRQSTKRHGANVQVKSKLGTLSKKLRAASTDGKAEEAGTLLKEATSGLDKAAKNRRLHKRTAARRISRLAKQANKAKSASASE